MIVKDEQGAFIIEDEARATLSDNDDMKLAISEADFALSCLRSLWFRSNKVSLLRRLRLYNAFILPVLLYPASTLALTQA
jgi:hypothetical protein